MLINVLKKMEQRPGMYGCESAEDIQRFILGYSTALHEYNVKENPSDSELFVGFTEFVMKYYHLESSHHNWAGIIRYYSSGINSTVEDFFKIFNQFIQEKNK